MDKLTFKNEEDGVAAHVSVGEKGGFNVTLQDTDSGEYLPTAFVGIQSLERAIELAKEIANI